ncbi:MAG: EamA family transporter [Gammaproteobacteria bacterium]|nr:EamA family transporter [Gammaproteobacteria bacterium]
MAQKLRKASPFDVFRLVLVGAIWGAAFIFISIAIETFEPITIAAVRVALAAIILTAVSVVIRHSFPATLSDWRRVTVVGLFNSAIPFFLISWGQQYTSSAEAALLMATGTFCALLISHFTTTDERINWPRGVGVLIGFSGVFVLVVVELMQTGLGGLKGQIAVMAAGASYATSSVLARRISHLPAISTSAAIMASASCYLIPLALIFEHPLTIELNASAVLSILFLGVIATAFAFVVRFAVIRDNGAVFMAQVGYLVPLFGVLWSWLFLSEAITVQTWVALVCIVIGIAFTRKGVK